MFAEIILISCVGGLLCLDRVFIQAMISRPIVVAPVIGVILGHPNVGLVIGAIIELLWIDRIPIGIYIPPNDSVAAALATSTAILAGGSQGEIPREVIALAVLLAIPFGVLARRIDIQIVESNNLLSDQALEAAKALDIRAIERKTYFGLAKVFLAYVGLLFILQMCFIPTVIWLYPQLPTEILAMLSLTYYFLPLLGVAVAINTIKLRGAIPVFCAIVLVIAVVMDYFHVF